MAGPQGYQELPPFLHTMGREKLLWRVSWLNAITFMFSLIGGRAIAAALFGHSLAGVAATGVIIVGAVALTCEYHGLLLGRRLLIRLRFLVRALSRRTTVNGLRAPYGQTDAVLDDAVTAAPQVLLVAGRAAGTREHGLPLVGPALAERDPGGGA